MKVLKSGLLLVNGPFKLNACPLRRIHQNFVIATSTKIDISSVNIPEKINDKYFQRVKDAKKGKKDDGEIFAKKAERYTPSEERKKDQAEIDKQLIAAIKKNPVSRSLPNSSLLRRQGLSRVQDQHEHGLALLVLWPFGLILPFCCVP